MFGQKNPITEKTRCKRSLRNKPRPANDVFHGGRVRSATEDLAFPLSKSPNVAASIGIILLPQEDILVNFSFPSSSTEEFITAQPMLFVPKSRPNIFHNQFLLLYVGRRH